MMAQQLMTDALGNEFSDSPFFAGKVRPSDNERMRLSDFKKFGEPALGSITPYQVGATGSLFLPGAGVADVLGQAPDLARPGQTLPSFGQNIAEGSSLMRDCRLLARLVMYCLPCRLYYRLPLLSERR